MFRTEFLIVALMLTIGVPAGVAQSRQSSSDSISGSWTGELTPAGASKGTAVVLQLKFDGKGTVSGTFSGLQNPGDVKKGTYVAKTGALTLQLGKQGEPAVLLTLDGTVAKGVATGRFSGEMAGAFRLTKKD